MKPSSKASIRRVKRYIFKVRNVGLLIKLQQRIPPGIYTTNVSGASFDAKGFMTLNLSNVRVKE
jgi:hypothetical protein